MEALDIRAGPANTVIHIPAAYPARSGSHAYLVPSSIIPHAGTQDVCAMAVIITGITNVISAIIDRGVDILPNRIPPVIVM